MKKLFAIYQRRLRAGEGETNSETSRQAVMKRIKGLMETLDFGGHPVLDSAIDEVMVFCFEHLPVSDIEISNRVWYDGRMFEEAGELADFSIMAKFYDTAAISLGMGLQWAALINEHSTRKKENAELTLQRRKESVEKWKRFADDAGPTLAMSAWCVVLALADFRNEWSYDLSKWALCGGCLYRGWLFWKAGMRRGLLPLGILAVIFNPFAPIRFDEEEWRIFDWIAAAVFFYYVPGLRARLINLRRHWLLIGLGVVAVWAAITFVNYVNRMSPMWKMQREARETRINDEKAKKKEKDFDSSPAGRVFRDTWERDHPSIKFELPSELYRSSDGLDPKTEGWYPAERGIIHGVETKEEFRNPTK